MSQPVAEQTTTSPPPGQGRRKVVIAVVAIALAISVIAAYFVLAPRGPSVALAPATPFMGGHIVNVSQVSPPVPLSDCTAVLAAGTSTEGQLSPLADHATNGSLGFLDVDGDQKLSQRDAFVIAPLPGGNHALTVRWRGNLVATRTIAVSQIPQLLFTSATAITDGFEFQVAGTTGQRPAANFRVNLQAESTAGTAVTLSPSMSITVGGEMYTITWTDIGGEGTLSAGDAFRVTRAGGLLPATSYTVLFTWSDGTPVGSRTYP